MNNISYLREEFDKRRTYKGASSFCQAYECPIFQNCLLEIKQSQEENKRLNGAIQTYDILLKSNVEENKQLKEKINLRNREKTDICNRIHNQKEKSKRHKKEITDLIAKNQALKIQISAREEVCNRLESNWNMLKEWLKNNIDKPNIKFILETMQELEQGSDN